MPDTPRARPRHHRAVGSECRKLFDGGHFQQGVVAATSALRDLVRSKSGLNLDGDALMGKAFGGSDPFIIVGDSSTETGRNMQRAVLSLAQGIMAGLRNPLVHETVELEPHEAMEMVAVISLVAR